jgi:hypothetical protein
MAEHLGSFGLVTVGAQVFGVFVGVRTTVGERNLMVHHPGDADDALCAAVLA